MHCRKLTWNLGCARVLAWACIASLTAILLATVAPKALSSGMSPSSSIPFQPAVPTSAFHEDASILAGSCVRRS